MTTTHGFRRIFRSFVLNPIEPGRVELYDPGYLVVEYGRILRLTSEDPRQEFPDARFMDFSGKAIIPGLIDTHVHLPQYGILGVGRGELLEWLRDYTYPEEARFADPEYAWTISETFFKELVLNGTTAAAIYSSVHEEATDIAFRMAGKARIRAFIGKVMMDHNSPEELSETTADSLRASNRLFEKWDGADGGRLRYVYTPRFAGSCSMELLRQAGSAARERGAFVQSHLSENQEEVRLIRKLFPESSSYTDVYHRAGLLHGKSIMAHCIHLSPEEVQLMARTRTNVAFCPYSNRTLRSGTMPYKVLREAGLNIGLGTDIAGGPSISMLDQIKEASPIASPEEALYLATLGGAKVLGLEDYVGNFKPGKDADFVITDRDRNSVSAVYVQGEQVYPFTI